ncbi:unnamed protein product [Caenorhabditis sp. 36 PRJEB53466]|nr:unnamed protein product [Caenorhabditis sp. 36 PRJEB53466]
MRYLVELGSPESAYHTLFCCSHIIIASFIFLIIDATLTLWLFLFELFVTNYQGIPDQVWVVFHAISLISIASGGMALCDWPSAVIVYGCRISLILGITIVRFIISIREFSSSDEPTLSELANLFQIIPVVVYTVGVFLIMRLFSYSTGRYRGYYDVDLELRQEVKRKFAEFEASLADAPASHKTD